ncbi:MAG: two-component regulator propeller domain-containing protein [Candidatus Neomarinimicrobiota bacterium]
MILFCLSPTRAFDLDPKPRFDKLTIEQGLSQNSVFCIIQDNQGFMWFGTEEGLNRFDGADYLIYSAVPGAENSLSGNTIYYLLEDRRGDLWVAVYGYGLNRFDRTRNRFIHYRHDPEDSTSLASDFVWNMYMDKHGNLWVGTDGGGLDRFDLAQQKFIHYRHDSTRAAAISDDHIYGIIEDHQGTLWVGTANGLNRYCSENDTFQPYFHDAQDLTSLGKNSITCLLADEQGMIWVGTDGGGLDCYHTATGRFSHYRYDQDDLSSLSDDHVTALLIDDDGVLWVGTEDGLNLYQTDSGKFKRIEADITDAGSLSDEGILSLYKDRVGNIWVGTINGGVNFLNRYRKPFNHVRSSALKPDVLTDNSVYSFFEDSRRRIWIGTVEGLNRYDPVTGQYRHYLHDANDPGSISDNGIWTIMSDHSGNIWIGTDEGLNKYLPANDSFARYYADPERKYYGGVNTVYFLYQRTGESIWAGTGKGLFSFNPQSGEFSKPYLTAATDSLLSEFSITAILEDHYDYLWLGTETAGVFRIDPQRTVTDHFKPLAGQPGCISSFDITSISEDKAGQIWIGTYGGGLNQYDRSTGKFNSFTSADGLPNNVVYGVLEDERGFLWLSTNNGLSRFDVRNRRFHNYDARDGLQGDEFNAGAYLRDSQGQMFFGGIQGFNVFHPDSVIDNNNIAPVVLTDFLLFNKPLEVGPESLLTSAIDRLDQIELSYNDYVFSIRYAILNFNLPEKNQYAYKLEGFESDWNFVGKQHSATYTNIPSGEYTFRVNGCNNDGIWNTNGASLKIIIQPPFWRTVWFRLLAFSFLIGLAQFIYRARTQSIKTHSRELEQINLVLKQEIEERKKAEQEREQALILARQSDKVKSLFLANMSHEIRTPLNSILGYSDLLEKSLQDRLDADEMEFLQSIRRGGDRLMNTVHAILDISQIEAGSYSLNPERIELTELLHKLVYDLRPQATVKKLALNFKSMINPAWVMADQYCLSHAITNVIENAIKYTDQGSVSVVLGAAANDYRITVVDTGIGISAEYQKQLFEPFSQESTGYNKKFQGVGLGLTLTRKFLELSNAAIAVESQKKQGTIFTITIPAADVLKPTAVDNQPEIIDPLDNATTRSYYRGKHMVLVVEDDKSNRELMGHYLGDRYRITFAETVLEAKRIMSSNMVDAVVLDLSLRGDEDGLDLVRYMRETPEWEKIPVIVVTAHAFVSDRNRVLEEGCNEFLTKPLKQSLLIEKLEEHL